MHFSILTAVLISITLLFEFSAAQVPSSESETCNEDFAKFLVSQQASESGTVKESDKRVRILVRSANFLWDLDEQTARGYFSDAFKVAVDNYREKGVETRPIVEGERTALANKPDYRFEVVRAIAVKDSNWAKKLSEEIMTEFEKTMNERNENDRTREINDLLQLAVKSAKSDPNLSWFLLRRIMKYPLDQYWYFSLYSVAEANRSMSSALYIELLRNYRNETPRRLLFLSAFPFANERIFGIDKFQYDTSIPDDLQPDPDLQRRFIEVFFDRIAFIAANPEERIGQPTNFRQPEAVYIMTALQEIESIVIQKLPDLVLRFMEVKTLALSLLTDDMRQNLTNREKSQASLSQSFKERLEALEEADKEGKLRDALIVNLVTWGKKSEEQFRKLEPWLDKIVEKSTRESSTNYFWFLRSKHAIETGRYADAERFAAKVPEIEHRAVLAFDLVQPQLQNVNDAAFIYQSLNEIAKMVRLTENSATKAKILLGLANEYEKINHGFAIEELSEAIRVINRLNEPDLFSTSVFRQITGKDFTFYAVFQIPGYDLENTFRVFGKNDFDLTLSNAKALEDNYFRTLAILAVAGNCVEKTKRPISALKKNN